MKKEEALSRIKGYLTNLLPSEEYSEVEEIIKALEKETCEDCKHKRGHSCRSFRHLINEDFYCANAERKEYIDKIATLDALEKEKRKAESKVLENTHSIIKDSSNCGRLFGVSDSQKIVYDIPTADVVEREKIDKAIEEMERYSTSFEYANRHDLASAVDCCIGMIQKNIGESK